ncbi:MAG: hypothetical protein JW912_08285 [Sedimentisphaerales bacterium]|nr:hypothetical protein [Sedimentisphaerales bacterium]
MNTKAVTNKYSIAEVVLLVTFAFSLLVGYYIVQERQKIRLSPPIKLDYTGVSVSIPSGEGWKNFGSWQFRENDSDYMLSAQMTSRGHVLAIVRWRYILASEKITTYQLLAKRAADGGAEIVKTSQYSVGDALIEWAQATVPGGLKNVFFGIAQLDNGRTLEVDAMAPSDQDLARLIFRRVCNSLKYRPNDLLNKGDNFIANIKNFGTTNLIEKDTGSTWEKVYLIDGNSGNTKGYTLETFNKINPSTDNMNIKSDSRKYLSYEGGWIKENTFFKCDNRFDNFFMQTQLSSSNTNRPHMTVIDHNSLNGMKVVSQALSEDIVCWPGDNIVPDILLDSILPAYIDSEYTDMMIDTVRPGGQIVPVLVSKISSEQAKEFDPKAHYAVSLDFLDLNKKHQQILFDQDKNIIKKIDSPREAQIWLRSNRKTLLEKFPNDTENVTRDNTGSSIFNLISDY